MPDVLAARSRRDPNSSSEAELRAQLHKCLLVAFPPDELRRVLAPVVPALFFHHIDPGSPASFTEQVIRRLHEEGLLPHHAGTILGTLLAERPALTEQFHAFARMWNVELPHAAAGPTHDSPADVCTLVEQLDRDLRARESADQAGLLALNRRIHGLAEQIRARLGFPKIGQLRAGCRLLQPIGSGSFGSVWLADGGKFLAVKAFHLDKLETDVMLCRFLRSITAMRRLHDDRRCPDSIIRLHDVDLSTLSFAMEHASLGTLEDPRVFHWGFDKKIDVVYRLCQAMEFAHGLGVVHRDLKPNNILLADGDRPIITDFDLVAFRHKDSTVGGSSAVLGSLTFAAPEQLLNPHEATEQADIYSLGRLMYFLLLKRLPAPALRGPTEVAEIDGVPRPYLEVIRRATEHDIRDRYRSVTEMLLDIQRAQTGWAKITTMWRRGARWSRNNRGPLGFASTLALAGLTVVGIQEHNRRTLAELNVRFDLASTQIAETQGQREAKLQQLLAEREEVCALDIEIARMTDSDPALPSKLTRRRQLDESLARTSQELSALSEALHEQWDRLDEVRRAAREHGGLADGPPAGTLAVIDLDLSVVPARPEPAPAPSICDPIDAPTAPAEPPTPPDKKRVQPKPPPAPKLPTEKSVHGALELALERDCSADIQFRQDVTLQLRLVAGRFRLDNLETPNSLWRCISGVVARFEVPSFAGSERYRSTVTLPRMTLNHITTR
ncbi:serine/threonine-protein kinase [Nannocystis punicea]|uniref:Serine/threonine-protein kinase n=1 Tax=Nannocystis punicea TaxID=2995304 RepID=A0ABY7GSR1_9BACT|nr:serine/threonine-protein kinase [Nannocystis poenicansa]WAS89977.1 serine/threonine-protein kinase [Nannocystis poenicansa]